MIKIHKVIPQKVRGGVRIWARVPSNTDHRKRHTVVYIRTSSKRRWACSCPDFEMRRIGKSRNCRHIHQVRKILTKPSRKG